MSHLIEQIKCAASAVHTQLGPGLSRPAYEACLEHELHRRGLRVERAKEFPAYYKGLRLDDAYRVDLLVAGSVVVQVKAEDRPRQTQRVELENFLRLSGMKEGLTLNFNVEHIAHGVVTARETTVSRWNRWRDAARKRQATRRAATPWEHPVLGCPIEGGVMRRL